MSSEDFDLWTPTLAVIVSVLFVNYFIPIRTRFDHALATTLGAAVIWGIGALVAQAELVFFRIGYLVIVAFIADFISTFICFTDRIRNAMVMAIVFTPLHLGLLSGILLLFGVVRVTP
jgi:hypothetical protein